MKEIYMKPGRKGREVTKGTNHTHQSMDTDRRQQGQRKVLP